MPTYEAKEMIRVHGVTIHYAVVGEGRPVILAHGNGEDHHALSTEIRQLSEAGYRVYAPDTRGHGANERLEEYHYADMAEDMFAMIKALGLYKPAFYGFSDGGIVGLLLAINHPGVLGALAVSGANLSPAGLVPDFLAEYTAKNKEQPNPLITLMLTEPQIDPADMQKINIPVLVTAGEYDLILRSETQRIGEALPDAKVVIVEGADHGSYIEGSEIMGDLLIDFFKERW